METYKRPNMTSSPQINLDVEEFDELVVAAHFGSHAFLTKFLECTPEDCIREESPAKVLKWAMQSGDLTAANILLQSGTLRNKLHSGPLICSIMTIWNLREKSKQSDTVFEEQWSLLLSLLVNQFFDNINDTSSLDWANTILCSAARKGCLPVIEALFKKANSQRNSKLATALLAETQVDSPYQSIGDAVFWGQTHVVKYLLTQQDYIDMTTHLHHHAKSLSAGPADRNVLHLAANSRNPEIIRILAERFPQGVNETTDGGDTPLMLLVFARPTNVEAVRVLLEVGGADVNLSPGGTYYSPLNTAIRAGNLEVCQMLVERGARVSDVVGVDKVSGSMELKREDGVQDTEALTAILKVLIERYKGEGTNELED